MCSDDAKTLEVTLCNNAKRGTFLLEDIEAFKYTFATCSTY